MWTSFFSSPQAHFSDDCAAVAGHLWIQGVLPAAPGPRVAPALSPGAGEEPREKALGYQGEPVSLPSCVLTDFFV